VTDPVQVFDNPFFEAVKVTELVPTSMQVYAVLDKLNAGAPQLSLLPLSILTVLRAAFPAPSRTNTAFLQIALGAVLS